MTFDVFTRLSQQKSPQRLCLYHGYADVTIGRPAFAPGRNSVCCGAGRFDHPGCKITQKAYIPRMYLHKFPHVNRCNMSLRSEVQNYHCCTLAVLFWFCFLACYSYMNGQAETECRVTRGGWQQLIICRTGLELGNSTENTTAIYELNIMRLSHAPVESYNML